MLQFMGSKSETRLSNWTNSGFNLLVVLHVHAQSHNLLVSDEVYLMLSETGTDP